MTYLFYFRAEVFGDSGGAGGNNSGVHCDGGWADGALLCWPASSHNHALS